MSLFFSIEDDLYQQAAKYWGWWDRSKLTFGANRPSTQFADCDWEMDLSYNGDTRTLAYPRVAFSKLINDLSSYWAVVQIDHALTGDEVIAAISTQLGIPVTAVDFDNPVLPYASGMVQLSASANSRAFTGVLKFYVRAVAVVPVILPLNQYTYNFRNQMWYAHYDYEDTISGYTWTAKFNPGVLTYGLDYTSQADFFKTLASFAPPWVAGNCITNATALTNLANALKAVDGINWLTTSTRTDYSLYNAWCMYNGPVAGIDPTLTNVMGDVFIYPATRLRTQAKVQGVPNPEYDNVAVIQLGTPYSGGVGYQFCLMVHYNNWS